MPEMLPEITSAIGIGLVSGDTSTITETLPGWRLHFYHVGAGIGEVFATQLAVFVGQLQDA